MYNNLYIAQNEDLFNIEIPNFQPVPVTTQQTNFLQEENSVQDLLMGSRLSSFLVIGLCILLIITIFAILRKISNRSINKYTQQQLKKKRNAGFVSSNNKLETPENLQESIRTFLERTK